MGWRAQRGRPISEAPRYRVVKSIVNVEPSPGTLTSVNEKPIDSQYCREMASPNPVPPNRRVIVVSSCANGSKIVA